MFEVAKLFPGRVTIELPTSMAGFLLSKRLRSDSSQSIAASKPKSDIDLRLKIAKKKKFRCLTMFSTMEGEGMRTTGLKPHLRPTSASEVTALSSRSSAFSLVMHTAACIMTFVSLDT